MAILSCIAIDAYAMTNAEKGLVIAKNQVAKNEGWEDSKSKVQMVLTSSNGRTYERDINIRNLENSDDGDKSLITFNKPLDVKGTAFLTYSHINKPDEQWIYLPAVKRTKRISSKNKSGPFMGSEFSYEDMSPFEYEEFEFTYLREEELNGEVCFVVEQRPKDRYSGYSKRVVWVDKSEYRIHKVDFYDRKNDLLKTLNNKNYKLYLNKYWRQGVSEMVNHKTSKSTKLNWIDYQFGNNFKPSDFNRHSLKRVR